MACEVKPGGMKRYLAGDIVFKEKEIHPYMYKVLKGSVALYVNHEKEHENVLGILEENRFFGEISMLTGRPQVYTAVALNDVLLMRVSEEQLESFLSENRGNTLGIMKSMAKIIVTQSLDISMLMEDLNEILKDLPDDNALDPKVVTRLKQYQLKYVEKTYNPEDSFFSAEV